MNFKSLLKQRLSLRNQLSISMILLVLVAALLILGAAYIQHQAEADSYNSKRLDRKENQIRRQLNYMVKKHHLELASDSVWAAYENDLSAITKIHSVQFSLFNLKGEPLFVSFAPLKIIANGYKLDETMVAAIREKNGKQRC